MYRLDNRTYMFKLMCSIHNCVELFEEIVRRTSITTETEDNVKDKTANLFRTNYSFMESFMDVNLDKFCENRYRLSKLFVRLKGHKKLSAKSKWKSTAACKKFKKCPIRLRSITLELLNDQNQKASKLFSRITMLESFFFANLNGAYPTEMGIYYELTRYNQIPEITPFYDKYIKVSTCKMTWAECIVFFLLSCELLSLITTLMINLFVTSFFNGKFIYVLSAVVATTFISMIHLVIIYFYKIGLRMWISLSLKKQKLVKRFAVGGTVCLSFVIGKFVFCQLSVSVLSCSCSYCHRNDSQHNANDVSVQVVQIVYSLPCTVSIHRWFVVVLDCHSI